MSICLILNFNPMPDFQHRRCYNVCDRSGIIKNVWFNICKVYSSDGCFNVQERAALLLVHSAKYHLYDRL